MPANLTADFKAAEERYRNAADHDEKIAALEEMLATVPKHKGTEKIQADIKAKLAKARKQPVKKSAGHHIDVAYVKKEGAGQVAVIGLPNSGKSQLVTRLTNAECRVAPYPFTTLAPQPAMLHHMDITIQLVDLPATGRDSPVPWVPQSVRNADAGLVVLDLGGADPVYEWREITASLEDKRITLVPTREQAVETPPPARFLPAIVIANRIDLGDAHELLDLVRTEIGVSWTVIGASGSTGEGCGEIGPALWGMLGMIRVYAKLRGKKPETEPFVFRQGETVLGFAEKIHKELADQFKFARVWNGRGLDGIRVSRDYLIEDGDIIEITS